MTITDWTAPLLAALDAVLGKFPTHLLAAYRQHWAPTYAVPQIRPAGGESAA